MKEKKSKEKTTPFGVNLMSSQVLYRAAQVVVVTYVGGCRNRQVTAFYNVVDFFKPGFVLMENVVDIFKKEDGTYAKSAMASLLAMRYQVRAGIIAASGYGVPQIRNRSAQSLMCSFICITDMLT